MHRAARLGDGAAIRSLAREGADLNAVFDIDLDPEVSSYPVTPLMVAAGSGDGATVETVRLLLELGADPKRTAGPGSAAAFACSGLGWNYKPGGDAERLRVLLEAGSPLPADPEDSNWLLCDTAAAGDADRLRVLLRHGMRAGGHWDAAKARENQRAAMERMAKYRVSRPDPFASMPDEFRASRAESRKKEDEEAFERECSAPSRFEIPLFRAAESGSAECVAMLIATGADPLARDNDKHTAMYCAGSTPVVRVLRAAGVPLEDADEYGWSPLVAALIFGGYALARIRALIEAGADVNATHDHGHTVFMSAVGTGRHPEVLRLLIAAGADPHAICEFGYNAFHTAININGEGNAEESVRGTLGYLKQLGVDMERRNEGGCTPLAWAILRGNGTEVRVLCELGANPNAVCPKHKCGSGACTSADLPLLFHAADGIVWDEHVKTEALLRAGADPLVKDAEGCTPLVRVVAALCSDAPDYAGSFNAFFKGLWGLRFDGKPLAKTREEFIAEATPLLRAYVERFASDIPISKTSEYAERWRTERLSCIVSLCAYEGWVRHEQLRRVQ